MADFLPEIAQYGLLGILFVLAIIALVRRDRELQECRSARLEDAKGVRIMVEAATAARVEQNKLQEEHNRLTEKLTDKLNELVSRR